MRTSENQLSNPAIVDGRESHAMRQIKISIKQETEAVADGQSITSYGEAK